MIGAGQAILLDVTAVAPAAQAPTILELLVRPSSIQPGQTGQLCWAVASARQILPRPSSSAISE